MAERKTGLWKKTSASGVTYYFGQRDGVKVTLFKNNKRDGHENDPDLNVIVTIEDKEESGRQPGADDEGIPF